MNKKALVTGGAGFIGSNVARLLAGEGYRVTVFDNLSTGYRSNTDAIDGLNLIEGDVCNANAVEQAMSGVDVVFHLAASVGNVRSIERPIGDAETNVIGTLRVLEAARKAGVRKVVYSSSAGIFGELKHLPIAEDHPAEPDSPYGVTKLAGEKMCLAYAKLHGIEAVCLRYFNVYGINQRYDAYGNVIPIFARRMLRNEPLIIYGDGEQTRDFVNVCDVARANLIAAESQGVSGAFNIASGEAITINKLVVLMRQAGGSDVQVDYRPPRKGDVRHSRADLTLARHTFGYQPTADLHEGLTEYLQWAQHEFI